MRIIRFHRSVLPFIASFAGLILTSIAVDLTLYSLNISHLKRWAGPIGVLLLLLAFGYSLRRRRLISQGSVPRWLRSHEFFSWAGTLAIMVHAGLKINAFLPWAAILAMLFSTASGLTGTYILQSAKKRFKKNHKQLKSSDADDEEIEAHLIDGSLKVQALSGWRQRHIPVTFTFFFLSLMHIGSILFLW